MSRRNYPVFYIPVGEDRLDHKYCKVLQKETRSILSVSQREVLDPLKQIPYDASKWRILENYLEIKDILEDKFSNFAADLGIGNYVKDGSKHEDWTPTRARYQITTSWITDLKEGDFVQFHNHRNNNPLRIFSSYSPERPAIGLSTDWQRFPEPGLILFWQSYLEHGIDSVIRSDKHRRSLAFNIMPVGPYGEADSSMDTRWLNF